MGSKKRFDMVAEYQIFDGKGDHVQIKKETIAIETRGSKKVTIPLESLEAGTYTLKALVKYEDKEAFTTETFTIMEEEAEEEIPEDLSLIEDEIYKDFEFKS